MGFISIVVNAYEDPKEQGQFDVISGKLAAYYNNTSADITLLGNVRLGLHALDAVLLSRNGIMVLEFKNYSGDIRIYENVWENSRNGGPALTVKGGSGDKTPREQAEINRRGVIKACRDILGNKIDSLPPDYFFPATVIFNRSVKIHVMTPAAQPRWLKITDNDNLLSIIDNLAKNSAVFSDSELSMIKNSIGVRASHAIYDPNLEHAKELFSQGRYTECMNFIDHKCKKRYMEIDYIRAKCMLMLKLHGTVEELIRIRLDYRCAKTYYDEAYIFYTGTCGKREDKRLALQIAEKGKEAGDKQSQDLYYKIYDEIRFEDSLKKAHEQNKQRNDIFYNVLAYISLPLLAVAFIYLPILFAISPLLMPCLAGLLALYLAFNNYGIVMKLIPRKLTIRSFLPQNLDFIKEDDITERGKFYTKSFLLKLLPVVAIEILLAYLMNHDWVQNVDFKYFSLGAFCRLTFVLYSIYAGICVIRLLFEYGALIAGDANSIYTFDALDYNWDIQPNYKLLKESFVVAGKLCMIAAAIALIITFTLH